MNKQQIKEYLQKRFESYSSNGTDSSLCVEFCVSDLYEHLCTKNLMNEDLRQWFGKGKKGTTSGGGWDRYGSDGQKLGKCGDGEKGDAYAACLSKEKANKLGPKGRASFVNRKRADQKKAGDTKKGGNKTKGKKPTYSKTKANESSINEIPMGDLKKIDKFADKQLNPVDVVLTGKHFFDRLNDPRNYPDIEPYELEDFFEKLSDEKDEFITFLKKYRNVVVKDTETNINIPFMKAANKAIAKTIMRKKNFKTPDAILPLKEGRYDAEVTMISRMVVNVFKDAFGEKFETTFEDAGELDGDTFELETYFYPTPFDELGPIPFIINAAGDGDGIAIQVNYNPDSFPTAYNELIPEIKDAVRHELEHVSQYRNPNKEIKPGGVNQDDLPLYDYLTLDYEIPAFVQGLYKKAKTKKITLTKAIDDFLDERAEELSSDEEVKIKKIYTDWAKKNLPSAQFEGLSSKEQDIVDDILSEVNNLQEVDLDKLKEKIKLYGRKGMLTLSILLSVASGLQANPGTAKDIVDVGIEMVDTKGKTDFYNSMIGYISEIKQQAFKSGGDINMIGSLKELQLHYQALRDNETPAPLSIPAKASQESILKNMADLDMNTIQDYINMGQGTTIINEADPKKGTGKKPKGSGRRLYTDEDPKDTVKIKFSTRQDIVDTLNKTSFKNKSHARQSQVINLIHQRVRAAYGRSKKPEVKKRLKSALDYITKRKEASKAKTQRLKKQKANENVAPNHDQKSSPYGSGYKPLKEELTPHIISLTQFMGSNGLNLKPYPKVKFIDNDVNMVGIDFTDNNESILLEKNGYKITGTDDNNNINTNTQITGQSSKTKKHKSTLKIDITSAELQNKYIKEYIYETNKNNDIMLTDDEINEIMTINIEQNTKLQEINTSYTNNKFSGHYKLKRLEFSNLFAFYYQKVLYFFHYSNCVFLCFVYYRKVA